MEPFRRFAKRLLQAARRRIESSPYARSLALVTLSRFPRLSQKLRRASAAPAAARAIEPLPRPRQVDELGPAARAVLADIRAARTHAEAANK